MLIHNCKHCFAIACWMMSNENDSANEVISLCLPDVDIMSKFPMCICWRLKSYLFIVISNCCDSWTNDFIWQYIVQLLEPTVLVHCYRVPFCLFDIAIKSSASLNEKQPEDPTKLLILGEANWRYMCLLVKVEVSRALNTSSCSRCTNLVNLAPKSYLPARETPHNMLGISY